jgi:hypothetical protein
MNPLRPLALLSLCAWIGGLGKRKFGNFFWPGLAFLIALSTGVMVARAHLPIPINDQWLERTADLVRQNLFSPFNVHVILFSRLFFLLDFYIFSGTYAFSQTVILAIQLSTAAMLAYAAHRAKLSALYSSLAFIALLWAYNFANFLSGFCIHNVAVFAAAIGSFLSLAYCRKYGLALAITLGLIATMNWVNGIFVGIFLAPLAYALGLPRRQIWTAAVGGVAIIFLYLICVYIHPYGPMGGAQGNPSTLEFIGTAIAFFGILIGTPIARLIFQSSEMSNLSLISAAVIGYTCVALLAYHLVWVLKTPSLWRMGTAASDRTLAAIPEPLRRTLLVLVAISLFTLGTLAVIAIGRTMVFPLYSAATGRYGTPALILWVVTLYISAIVRSQKPNRLRAAVNVFSLLFTVAMVASQPFIIRMVIASPGMTSPNEQASGQYILPRHLADRTGALTATLSKVDDETAFYSIYQFNDQMLLNKAETLRAANLAPFDEVWAQWLGRPPAASIHETVPNCRGTINSFTPLGIHGWRTEGDFSSRLSRNYRRFILVADGTVVGYGLQSPGRTLWEAFFNTNSHWQGHIRPGTVGSVAVYALDDEMKSMCRLAEKDIK